MTELAITQSTPADDLIKLSFGQPDPALLPAQLFDGMSTDALSLAYGAALGDGRFRMALAEWLGRHYKQPVAAESLMITNGSSNAVEMICARYTLPGDTVLVEDPTYFIARRQFHDFGLHIVGVPMDEYGVDITALERLIRIHKPAFFYTIPAFHNPTGITMEPERRKQLIGLCHDLNCPVVADEVYQLLYYDQPPPPPLASIDPAAAVFSIGSFTKILAPGLRLGWIQSNAALLETLANSAFIQGGGGLAPFTSGLVQPLLKNGELDRHIKLLRDTYSQRRDVLARYLDEALGERIRFAIPGGGFFIWANWLDGSDAGNLLSSVLEYGVDYLPGREFSDSPDMKAAMRFCFAFYDEEKLITGCERLGRAFSA